MQLPELDALRPDSGEEFAVRLKAIENALVAIVVERRGCTGSVMFQSSTSPLRRTTSCPPAGLKAVSCGASGKFSSRSSCLQRPTILLFVDLPVK